MKDTALLTGLFNFSDSDYGKKKKKRGGGKAKKPKGFFQAKKPKRGGGSRRRREWSDESDFSDRPRKKKPRNTIPSADLDRSNIVESAGRRTRGVKVNYSLLEGSSDEATPEPAAKGKGKGPRKWDGSEDEFKPDSDVEKAEEDVLGEEEEDNSEDEVPSDEMEETPDEEEEEKPKKGKASRQLEESEEEEESSRDSRPDISEESEDSAPRAKPIRKPEGPSPKIKLLSQASPFPKAPPRNVDEEDSDDGFQSPATPSEDEDDD